MCSRTKCVVRQQLFDNDDFREHVAERIEQKNFPPNSLVSSIQKPINDEKSIRASRPVKLDLENTAE